WMTCVRHGALIAAGVDWRCCPDTIALGQVLLRMDPSSIGHVRRIIYRRRRERAEPERTPAQIHVNEKPTMPEPAVWPPVAIIIPTRDRPDLLAECVRGLAE